jgi:protein CpxP
MTRFLHRTLFAVFTFLLLTCAAMAQQPQGQSNDSSGQPQSDNQGGANQQPGRRGGAMQRQRQHMAMLAQKLNLTDAQKQQFWQITQSMRKQGMAIRQDSSLTEEQKKEKMQALRKQSHQEMFGVLNQEQKEQLKQMREQHQKDQGTSKTPGDQASAQKKPGTISDDDDPFAGMTSDDDDGPGNGGSF